MTSSIAQYVKKSNFKSVNVKNEDIEIKSDCKNIELSENERRDEETEMSECAGVLSQVKEMIVTRETSNFSFSTDIEMNLINDDDDNCVKYEKLDKRRTKNGKERIIWAIGTNGLSAA